MSWQRPAAEEPAAGFAPWSGGEAPPSHSIPPHRVAKAAARLGAHAFERIHERLLRAYFGESRDISDASVLRSLWLEVGLPEEALEASRDPDIAREILREHQEAQQLGASGVPAMRLAASDVVIVGAQPYELYQRWVRRALERRA